MILISQNKILRQNVYKMYVRYLHLIERTKHAAWLRTNWSQFVNEYDGVGAQEKTISGARSYRD